MDDNGQPREPSEPVRDLLATNHVASEGIRNVCASILLSRSERPPRMLMVTSSIPGEGKTTLVTALGRAFADSGAGTLLIECDLRCPTFSRRFNIGTDQGLSLFLSGHVGRAPTIHRLDGSNLFVVTAGPVVPNPPVLLGSDRMRGFLSEVTSSFRFVILDTPPVLPMADARLLAPMVEGVILVVRAGLVARPLVRRVRSVLEHSGANVLGAVLNGADVHGPDSSYYRYYSHYYGEGAERRGRK